MHGFIIFSGLSPAVIFQYIILFQKKTIILKLCQYSRHYKDTGYFVVEHYNTLR